MNWETYIAFGDSITIGARTYLGYPELVGNKLSETLNKEWNVINCAVSGYKAIDLSRHIDLNFSSLQTHKSAVSTLLIGTNDIKENTSVKDFKIALNQIILKTKLLTVNKNLILFAIPHFHQGIMYPYFIEMNPTIDLFNEVIFELAKKHQIRFLELTHSHDNFLDGVHLNQKGIENFADQISKFILKDKGYQIG